MSLFTAAFVNGRRKRETKLKPLTELRRLPKTSLRVENVLGLGSVFECAVEMFTTAICVMARSDASDVASRARRGGGFRPRCGSTEVWWVPPGSTVAEA